MTGRPDNGDFNEISQQSRMDDIRLEALKFARIGLARLALDGEIIFIDNGAFSILGLGETFSGPNAVQGKNISNIISLPDGAAGLLDNIAEKKQIREFEFQFTTLSGAKRWAACDAYLVDDETTGKQAAQIIARDISRRKKYEADLKESEDKFRSVTDEISDAALIVSNGEILWVNNSAARIFGESARSFTGRGLDSFLNPQSLAILSKSIESLLYGKSKGALKQQLTGFRDNGDPIHLEISIKKIYFDGQDAAQLVARDVTEQNIANDRLMRLAFEFQGVFEAFPDLYFKFDRNCSILDVKAGDINSFHLPPLEFINRNIKDIFPGETGALIAEKIKETANGKSNASVMYSLQYPDGTKYFEARFIPLTDGQVGAFIRDMTELKNAEQKLIESEKFLSNIFESIQDGISVLDNNLNILRVNHTTNKRFAGIAPLEGKQCYEAYHGFSEPCENCVSISAMQTGRACSAIVQMPENAVGNSRNWLEIFAFPLLDPNTNKSVGVIEFVRDITSRIAAEEEVRAYKEQLESLIEKRTAELNKVYEKLLSSERLAVLGQFAGGISHEIRNPLNVIATTVYYLKRKILHSDERVLPLLDKVQKQIDACAAIIESILRLTQLQAPMLKRVELLSFIKETIELKDIPSKITTTMNLPEQPITAMIDSGQIEIALNNLIKNSVQAMPDGGEITIELSRAIENSVNTAVMQIKDTGAGITQENIDRIFEPLFTTKIHGIGFGLSIVKAILEKHDGRITVQSSPQNGTTFTLYIPCDA